MVFDCAMDLFHSKNMCNFFSILFLAAVCIHQTWGIQPDCVNLSNQNGNITGMLPWFRDIDFEDYHACWNILNPLNRLLTIELKHLDFKNSRYCAWVNVTITANRTGERFKFCFNSDEKKPIAVYSGVTVALMLKTAIVGYNGAKVFELHYKIDDSIEGIKEARSRAVDLLKSKWSTWKWIDHIPKAVTAISLAEGPHFGDLEDYLMLKQRDIQILLSLERDVYLNDQISTFINSLLSSCHDPRHFYGYNLVKLLKDQVMSGNFTHPTSYLALCNANETWPDIAYQDLAKTYNSSIDVPFRREYEAFAVMALSCEIRRRGNYSIAKFKNLLDFYETNIQEFKALQKPSGSFGNVQRTALITQALIASGHEQESDWNYKKAMETLMESLNTSTTDIISIYLILPLLNGKSLTDIAFTNCSSLREHDDLVAEIHDDYLGPKIKIQYSLFVGDPKDVIFTIVLKVPKYYSAFDVMQLISRKYTKYQFKYELDSDRIDVYEMADIPNDPEGGKFWQFYLKRAAVGNQFKHFELGPNRPALDEGNHIAMWYKKAPSH